MKEPTKRELNIALVCDWLTNVGGAERVLLEIHKLYPDAPIYTSQYNPKKLDWFKNADVRTGWLQIFPSKLRRLISPLRQHYFSHLDLSSYDLVISVTGAEAKAVKTKSAKHDAYHLCYCHIPTQYYWGAYDDYLKNPGFGLLNPLVRLGLKILVKPLRKRDLAAAKNVDQFVTISKYAQSQIKKFYHQNSTVVHPPVNISNFSTSASKSQPQKSTRSTKSEKSKTTPELRDYYITTSRQVTWKRLDLCVKACIQLNRPLIMIGEGPEHNHLKRFAHNNPNIEFLPVMSQKDLAKYLKNAKAYLFPSLEPFGIAPVEALASGCPVIAYREGGALDYIEEGKNGVFFGHQTHNSLADAIEKFEKLKLNPEKIAKTATPFSTAHFDAELKKVIQNALKN